MDPLEILLPRERRRVEVEVALVLGRQRLEQFARAVVRVDHFDLDVRAVQAGVLLDEVQPAPQSVDLVRRVARGAVARQPADDALGRLDEALGEAHALLDRALPREAPHRNLERSATALRQRMLEEVFARQFIQMPEPERVPTTRRHVVDRAPLRRLRGHREDDVHHLVDGDDVERPFRYPGELRQRAAAVREDHRLGDAEPFDPAGEGMLERAFDDGRAHDCERVVAGQLIERLLGQGFRERVHVGPAQAARARGAGAHQTRRDPFVAKLFRLVRDRLRACTADQAARLGREPLEVLRLAGLVFGARAHRERRGRFRAPVDLAVEQLLGLRAARHAGDVRRRDVDDGLSARGFVQARGPHEVGLERLIERRVERDRRRRVDDEVDVVVDRRGGLHQVGVDRPDLLLEHLPQPLAADAVARRPEARTGQ